MEQIQVRTALYTLFLKVVKQAMKISIPYLPHNKLLKILEFWDHDLMTARKQTRKAWKKWWLDVQDQDKTRLDLGLSHHDQLL